MRLCHGQKFDLTANTQQDWSRCVSTNIFYDLKMKCQGYFHWKFPNFTWSNVLSGIKDANGWVFLKILEIVKLHKNLYIFPGCSSLVGCTDWNCCSPLQKCSEAEGDCDSDKDCREGLVCGKNNCREFNPKSPIAADCCVRKGEIILWCICFLMLKHHNVLYFFHCFKSLQKFTSMMYDPSHCLCKTCRKVVMKVTGQMVWRKHLNARGNVRCW